MKRRRRRRERKPREATEQARGGWTVRDGVLPGEGLCWGWTGPKPQGSGKSSLLGKVSHLVPLMLRKRKVGAGVGKKGTRQPYHGTLSS